MPLSSAEIFEDPSIHSFDPDQTVSIGSVWSGSTLYASLIMLTNKQTFFGCRYFAGVLRVNCPPPFRRKAEGHSFRHSVLPSFLPSVLPSFRPSVPLI